MSKNITDKIYTIRGQKVMLDYDLAELYGYTTSAFNQQVKNNIEKFEGRDFMFCLNPKDLAELSMSKKLISIQTKGIKGGRSKPTTSLHGAKAEKPSPKTAKYSAATVIARSRISSLYL